MRDGFMLLRVPGGDNPSGEAGILNDPRMGPILQAFPEKGKANHAEVFPERSFPDKGEP
jgi:hypothetical protein